MTNQQKAGTEYRKVREAAGLTVAQMARALGVGRVAIYRREQGQVKITREMQMSQAAALRSPEVRALRSDQLNGIVRPTAKPAKPVKIRRKRKPETLGQTLSKMVAALIPAEATQSANNPPTEETPTT